MSIDTAFPTPKEILSKLTDSERAQVVLDCLCVALCGAAIITVAALSIIYSCPFCALPCVMFVPMATVLVARIIESFALARGRIQKPKEVELQEMTASNPTSTKAV
jgi:hypothetical protein